MAPSTLGSAQAGDVVESCPRRLLVDPAVKASRTRCNGDRHSTVCLGPDPDLRKLTCVKIESPQAPAMIARPPEWKISRNQPLS